jgi:hypothetical protein
MFTKKALSLRGRFFAVMQWKNQRQKTANAQTEK